MAQPPQVRRIGLKEAIKMWEQKHGEKEKIGEVLEVKLNGWIPPIEKMDGSTSLLIKCEKLSLSTNMMERLSNLNALRNLKILAVGRNYLKSLMGVEVCADTLEEIWASYNTIEKPSRGVTVCKKLRVLYIAHNWVREWSEVSKLSELPKLEELILKGNPLEERFTSQFPDKTEKAEPGKLTPKDAAWQKEVGRKIIHLKKLDGFNILRLDEQE